MNGYISTPEERAHIAKVGMYRPEFDGDGLSAGEVTWPVPKL